MILRLARVPQPLSVMVKGALELIDSTDPGCVTWKQALMQATPEEPVTPTEASGSGTPLRVMVRRVLIADPAGTDRASAARYVPGLRMLI